MDPAGQQLGVRLGSVDSRALLEAGRLWQQPQYTETGKALLARIVAEETVAVPGPARCCCREKSVLPMTAAGGLTPAIFRRSWPPTLCVLARRGPLRDSNLRLLLETAPKGFTPDWVRYERKGWQLKTEKPPIGSYDAIRVYLWWACSMMAISRKRVCCNACADGGADHGAGGPPEKVNIATGKTSGQGQWASPRQCCRFYRTTRPGRCNASASPITIPARMPTTAQF